MRPKACGGLGLRDLEVFNLSLPAKKTWRFHHLPSALWVRFLSSLYCQHVSFLEVFCKPHISYAWKSILQGRDIVTRLARWQVGDREMINIWRDKWGPNGVILRDYMDPGFSTVSELLMDDPILWDVEVLERIFLAWLARDIQCISLSRFGLPDCLV